MRISRLLMLLAPLALAACVTVHRDAPQPDHTTVVVPPGSGSTVVCSNGAAPPCN